MPDIKVEDPSDSDDDPWANNSPNRPFDLDEWSESVALPTENGIDGAQIKFEHDASEEDELSRIQGMMDIPAFGGGSMTLNNAQRMMHEDMSFT